MDEHTNFLWSYFMKTKDEQVPIIIKHIRMLQNEPKVKVTVTILERIMTSRIILEREVS
jgi:hypothetical protein